jgi:MFS family permease
MTSIDSASSPLSEADHRAQLRRAVIASTVGTTIEWYDFFLYGQATGLVFGKLFFPKSDPLVGVLQAFAIYAVGFVARPVGAAIFGHYGDRIGRNSALLLLSASDNSANRQLGIFRNSGYRKIKYAN